MSQLQHWVRFCFFLGTIAPLLILQGIPELRRGSDRATLLFVSGALLFLLPLAIVPLSKAVSTTRLELAGTTLATPNLLSLLLGFFLPLVDLDLSDGTQLVLFIFIVLLLGIVSTGSNLVYLQPVFFMIGWHVYECQKSSGETCWILARDVLIPGSVQARDLGKHVWIR